MLTDKSNLLITVLAIAVLLGIVGYVYLWSEKQPISQTLATKIQPPPLFLLPATVKEVGKGYLIVEAPVFNLDKVSLNSDGGINLGEQIMQDVRVNISIATDIIEKESDLGQTVFIGLGDLEKDDIVTIESEYNIFGQTNISAKKIIRNNP